MPDIVRFGSYEADMAAGQLRKGGVKINLRGQSFQILASLLEHPGEVVTREQLQRRLWPADVFVDFENNLNTAVNRLREALCDSSDRPRYIETLPKRGYRFVAPVVAGRAPVTRARLVVLPFMNQSGDPADEYFSDAMTDEVITAVATLAPDRLAVIARTTAMHYKGSHKDVARIGRELNVDYVVEGGVRRSEGRVSINLQLIQVSDQTHLFAKLYNTETRGIFHTQRMIARAIGEHIPAIADGLHGDGSHHRRRPTDDFEAYNLFLQGRYHLHQWTPEGITKAKTFFEQAVARDPEFALAYDSLAEVFWWMGFLGFMRPKDTFSAGLFPALRSIEIDNTSAEAHALVAQFRKELDYNWPEVEREMAIALKLDPASPLVRFRNAGSGLMALGRLTEAIAELEKALEFDPMDLNMRSWLAILHWLDRNYEHATEQALRVIQVNPSYPLGHLALGQTRCMERKFDQAIPALQKAVELYGGAPVVLGWLGLALGQSGNQAAAHALLDRMHAITAQAYVPSSGFAWTHVGLGEIDEAFRWMDQAIDERDPMMVPIKSYPFLDPLRDDPRFHALLRKMNFEP